MKELLFELIKGLCIAFGIIIGLLSVAYVIIRQLKKGDKYEAGDLVVPFELYLQRVQDDELYEEIAFVNSILGSLRKGVVPYEVMLYNIKTDKSISMTEDYNKGSNMIRFVNEYSIIERIKTPTK